MSVEIWGVSQLPAGVSAAYASGSQIAYLTDFAGQGPIARVVYRGSDNHIWELYYVPSEAKWHSADLIGYAGGWASEAAGQPLAYLTDFPNEGPTARVVYQGTDSHLWELFYIGAHAVWSVTDLTADYGGAPAAAPPFPYMTAFLTQGTTRPASRLVYQGTDNHIWEHYYYGLPGSGGAADLTALARGEAAAAPPIAYLTYFATQGPTAGGVPGD